MHLSFGIHTTMRSIYQTHVGLENVRLYQNNEKKNEEFENQYTHEEKSGSFQKERKKKKKKNQFTHFEVFFFNSQNKMKKK